MKTILLITWAILPLLALGQSVERQVIASSGQFASGGGYSHSYTLGETATLTLTEEALILTQGFQQSAQSSVSIEEPELDLSVNAFPNPTQDAITIDLTSSQLLTIQVELFDAAGRSIPAGQSMVKVTGRTQMHIDLKTQAPGSYFVRLSDIEGKMNKTIQIKKVN
jgi:hypothetical protein